MPTLRDAFIHELKDIYSAEKQITEALPKMIEAASDQELRAAFSSHLEETRGQIERLDQIFANLGETPGQETCEAMKGLVKEGESLIEDHPAGPTRDALLICGAQKVEHYEIATYGTLVAWADALDLDDCEDLLETTLDEEADADEKLTDVAEGGLLEEGVNEEALSRS